MTLTLNSATYTANVNSNSATVTISAAGLQGLTNGSTYSLTANVTDAAGNAATQVTSSNFTVDTTAPTISAITTFNWGASLNATEDNSDQTVTITTSGAENDQTVTLTLNSATYTADVSSNNATVTITAAGLQALTDGVNYTLTADVSDAAGNAATQVTSDAFLVDKSAAIDPIATSNFSWGSSLNATEDNSNGTVSVTTTGVDNGQTVTLTLNSATYTANVNSNSATVTISAAGLQGLTNGSTYSLTANVTDAAGNAATQVTSSNFTVDTTAPTLVSAEQWDTNGDGNIDEIVIKMNEAIDDATVDFSDFSLGSGSIDGITASSASPNDPADNDKYIAFKVTVTGTGTVTVVYDDNDTGNDLSDIAGNNAADNTSITVVDKALPVITNTQWQDINSDGKIDRAVLTFSESVNITDGSAGDGFGTVLINDGSAKTIDNNDYVATSSTTLTLNFTGGSQITGTGIAGLSATYNAGSNSIKDASNQEIANGASKSYSDGAKPVLLSASYKDINPSGQPDGTVDRVDVIYSEDITASTFEAGDWTFPTNGASFTAASAALNGSTVEITVTGAAAETTVFGATTVLYTATAGTVNSITDAAATPNTALTSSATTVDDAAPPTMISAITGDANTDGTIDQIVVTFSEPVDLTSVDKNSFTLTESASGSPVISSSGVGDGTYSSSNATSITFNLTGVTPDNTSLTIDLNYNDPGGTIIDDSSNEMWFNESITGSDGVGPTVVITATDGTMSTAGNVVNNGSTTTTDVGLILTFTLSEPSSDFDIDDVSIANGFISDTLTKVSSTVYTAHFAARQEGITATVDVTTGGFTDAGGTANNVATTQFVWTLDIPMTFAAGSWVHLSCKDAGDGQITVKGADGSLPTDGSGTYEYDIATTVGGLFDEGYVDNTSNVFSGLAAGTYYIGFSDQGDDPDHFSYSDAITIREPSINLTSDIGTDASDQIVNNISCYGESINSASIIVTGGVGDITSVNPDEFGIMDYDISTIAGTLFDDNDSVQSSNTFNNLTAGTYYVGARRIINYDINGNGNDDAGDETGRYCESAEITVVIISPDSLTLNVDLNPENTFGPLCYGESSGQITTMVTGGTGNLFYSASLVDGAFNYNSGIENRTAPFNTTTTRALSGGSAGTWYVSVKDANGCEVEVRPDSVVADVPNELSIASVSGTDLTSNCLSDGKIKVIMDAGKEGAGDLSYSFLAATSKPGTGAFNPYITNGGQFNNVPADSSYFVAVRDANQCVVVSDSRVTINAPDELVVAIYKENTSCKDNADGAIHAEVSGGTAPYKYQWEFSSDNRTDYLAYPDTSPDDSSSIVNLKKGYYRLTVTDANECKAIRENTWYAGGNMHIFDAFGSTGGGNLRCFGLQNGEINATFYLDDTEEQTNFSIIKWTDPFGVAITTGTLGTNTSYEDENDIRRFYRKDSLGIPNGRIDSLGPGTYTALVDNGLGCRFNVSYSWGSPKELLWAAPSERASLASGVSTIDYITTTRDLSSSQYDINCVTLGSGTPSIRYGVDSLAAIATIDASTLIVPAGIAEYVVFHEVDSGKIVTLTAPSGATWSRVNFASYGSPVDAAFGDGIADRTGDCHARNSRDILDSLIIGRNTVTFRANHATFAPGTDLPSASLFLPGCASGKTLAYNISYAYSNDASAYDTISGGRVYDAGYRDFTDFFGNTVSRYERESYFDFTIVDLSDFTKQTFIKDELYDNPDGPADTIHIGHFTAEGLPKGDYMVWFTDGNNCRSDTKIFKIDGPDTGFDIQTIDTGDISCFGASDGTAAVVYTDLTPPDHPRPKDKTLWYKLANALSFDGNIDYVEIPQPISGSFTLEYWMKTSQVSLTGTHWRFGSGIVDAYVAMATTGFGTSLLNGKLAFGIGGPDVTLQSSTTVNDGEWKHVAVSWDQTTGTMNLYINGSLEATGAGSTMARTAPTKIRIGSIQTDNNFFNGSLDELRIWDGVRSSEEIKANLHNELTGTETDLTAYYDFNQGTAGETNPSIVTLTDKGPSGLTGNLNGFTASNFNEGHIGSLLTKYTGLETIDSLAAGVYKSLITDVYGCTKEQTFRIAEPMLLVITETITNVACLTDDEEDFGNALNFNATDLNRIVVADNDSLDMTSALTIEAWIYPTKNSGAQSIVSKLSSAEAYGYKLTSDNGWSNVFFHLYSNASNTNITSDVALTPVLLDSWHHIAATYDGADMKIFIDGIEVKSVSKIGNIKTNTNDLVIGAQRSSSGNADGNFTNYFEGSLDELRIWNVARSAAQINYSKEITLDGDEAGLVAYYQFNQGTAEGNNSGITSLTEEINSLNGAFPDSTAFDLTGSTSNFVNSYDNTPAAAAASGAIEVVVTGGSSSYSYQWFKGSEEVVGQTTANLNPASGYPIDASAEFTVVVTDNTSKCFLTEKFNVEVAATLSLTGVVTTPACKGGTDGALNITAGGGISYDYAWTKVINDELFTGFAETTEDLTGLSDGSYDVTITEQTSRCTFSRSFDIASPNTTYSINPTTIISETVAALPNETVQSNVSCRDAKDGYIEVKMTVDRAHPTDFDYAWYAGTSAAVDSLILVGEKNVYNLKPGKYFFQITDFYGCIKDATYTIVEYSFIDIKDTPVTNLSNSCSEANDASIGIEVAGGNINNYTYIWYKNDVVFDPADSAWTDEALSTLAIGLYKVIVTDEQGCSENKSFEITAPESLSLSYSKEDNICLGGNIGAIDVEVSGGTAPYYYAWKLGVTDVGDRDTLSNLTKDDYLLTVTDSAGCGPLTQTISIDGPETTFAIGFTTTDLTCYESTDGTIALDLSLTGAHPNDYEISWYKEGDMFNSVTETLSDLEVNNYRVIVTDTFGCTKTDSVTLVQPDDIYLRPVIDPLLCFDANSASITLNPTGGSDSYPSVDWSLAGTPRASDVLFVGALATGNYKVLLTDANGCKKDSVITVVNPANMSINTEETQIFDVLCKGLSTGSIEFSVENGKADYAYAWSQAETGFSSTEKDVQDLPIGNYDLTVTDDYGCVSDLFSFEITEPDNLFNINGDIAEVSCLDDSNGKIFVSLEVLGASTEFTYVWNRNGILLAEDVRDLANLSPATYLFAATDNFGCTKTDTFELANPEVISALFDPIAPSCYGDSTGSLTVSASGGWGDYEYDWRNPINDIGNNDSVLSNILSGNYLVRITDGAGCLEHFPITLEGPDALSITAVITDNSCNTPINAGIAISVTGGTPSYSYQWLENGADYATTQNIDALTADRYELIVTDSLSCEQSSGILDVITPEPISLTVLSSQDNLCTNSNTGSLFLQGSGGTFPYQYSIDGGSAGINSFFDGLAEGVHTFSITDTNNCSADSIITVLSEYELIANFSLDYTNPYIDWPISLNDSSTATDITSWFWELGNGAINQGQNTEVTYVAPGVYPITLKISNEVGCEAIKIDTLIVEKGYKLTMPSAFTPNEDGLNDVFTASHENIIRTNLQVYNKYGALVFESNVLNAEWNGELKEVPLPQDSYLYVIEYVAESGISRTQRGRFTLLR